jgi:hypothetical protein
MPSFGSTSGLKCPAPAADCWNSARLAPKLTHCVKAMLAPVEGSRREYRLGRRARTYAALLAGEVVAENHGAVLHRRGEACIVVQLRAQILERRLKHRRVLQFLLGQRFERLEAGTLVRLGKDDVEADQLDAVLVEQLVHQGGQLVPAPRPAPLLCERLLVDIENRDPLVHALRHGQANLRIVDQRVEVVDEGNLVETRGMAEQDQQNQQSEHVAGKILFQEISRNRLGFSLHPLRKNSIFTPASSITSWSAS